MDTNPNPEPNNELENAANAMNKAAIEADTPATMADATPIVEAPEVKEVTAAEAPVTAETPVTVAAAPASAEKKKGKKGLIIGITAGVVAALGIGGFVFAKVVDDSEENIALSVISDIFNNHAKTVSGSFDLTIKESDAQTVKGGMTNCAEDASGMTNCGGTDSYLPQTKSPVSHVRVDIKNDTNADNESKTSATFTVTYNDKDYSITVDSVVVKDYTLYVSISNLKDTIKQVMKEAATDSSMSSYSDYIELYEDLIDTVVGEVDGVWWKISIPDLVDSVDEISAGDKAKIKEAYSCVVDVANKASKDGNKYAEIYKNNAFVSISKYTGSAKPSASGDLYSVNLNADKFASFANAMADQVDSYGLEDCMKKLDGVQGVSTNYEKEEVLAKDYEKLFEALGENLIISVKNGFFSHKLSGIYFARENDSFDGVIDFKIDDLNGTIAAPTDTKDISDLVKNVTKAYKEWEETATCKYYKNNYPSMYNMYCDATTNRPKTNTRSTTYNI